MQAEKKNLEKSQVEISVSLSVEEFAPYIEKGARKIAEKVKIEGFRPGKAPLDVIKSKVGEMSILEEAAQLAVDKSVDEIISKNTMGLKPVGSPSVNVTKLAPGNPFEFKVILSVLPDVALGKYKELNLKIEKVKVEDKEIEKVLKEIQEMRAKETLEEKAAEDGDKLVIDIHLFLGNVPIEDGHHHDLAIILGKEYFVPGFDKKLLGAKAGEEIKFELLYPEDHHQKNLAGKMVNFEVKVEAVYKRELPEIGDAFAEEMRFKSIDDLKKALKENIEHEKSHDVELKNESEMISKIMDDTKFGDLPEILIESESRNIMLELEQNVVRQGGKFDDYLSHLKKTKDELAVELLPNAVKRVKSALIIREIAVVEKIDVEGKELDKKIEELKEQYKNNPEVQKMIAEPGYRQYLQNILTNEKVINKLKEWNYAPVSGK